MPVHVRPLLPLVALLLAAGASRGAAESRTVDTRRFPLLVAASCCCPRRPRSSRSLKDEKDRVVFQQIFWARRDPSPGTPANEFEDNVRAVWKNADDLFSYPNQKGSETGCGQVLALLGRPEDMLGPGDALRTPRVNVLSKEGRDLPPPPGPGRQFDNMAYLREGSEREPETWVYRDRPGLPYTFTGAELRVAFDEQCKYAEGAGFLGEDLRRAAAAFVTRPDITYSRGSDGHLAPLAAAAAASSGASAGAQALLGAPRNDFPLAAESKLLMRGPKGEAYVAGLVRAAAGATGPPARLSLAAQASDAAGQTVASSAREMTARPEADGSLVASWGLSLKPGRYKVTVAALLAEPSKGSVSTIDVEVPDFGGGALVASPLVVYPDEPPAGGAANARDPYAAMQLGPMRLHPRFGNVFAPTDRSWSSPRSTARRSTPPPARPRSARATASSRTAGRWRAAPRTCSRRPTPWPRSGRSRSPTTRPGAYVVRLDVTDAVTKQTLRQEIRLRDPETLSGAGGAAMRRCLSGLAVVLLVALPAPLTAGAVAAEAPQPPFPIWPLPREARVADTRLLLTEATIVVPPGDARAQYPGRLLAELVADHFGVALPVAVGSAPDGRTPIVVGEASAVDRGGRTRRRHGARGRRGLPPLDRRGGRRHRGTRLPRRPLRRLFLRPARPPVGEAERRRAPGARARLALPARALGAPLPAGPRPARLRPPHHAGPAAPLQVQRDRPRGGRRHAAREPPRDQRRLEAHRRRVVRPRRDDGQAGRGDPPRDGAALRRLPPRGGGRRGVRGEGRRPQARRPRRPLRPRDRPRGPVAQPHLLHRLAPGATWPRTRRWRGRTRTAPRIPSPTAFSSTSSTSTSTCCGRSACTSATTSGGRGLLPAMPRQGHGPSLRRGRPEDPPPPAEKGIETWMWGDHFVDGHNRFGKQWSEGGVVRYERPDTASARDRVAAETREIHVFNWSGEEGDATFRKLGWPFIVGNLAGSEEKDWRARVPGAAPSGARCRRGAPGTSSSSGSCRSPRRSTAATSSGPSTTRRKRMRSSTWATCCPRSAGSSPRSPSLRSRPTRCASRCSTSPPPSTPAPTAKAGTSPA